MDCLGFTPHPKKEQTQLTLPRITIITPSFNQGRYLEQTILSVLDQDYPNLDYIIIDGGSTDHSVEIIKKYASRLSYWVSEQDNGQAHAINKGLKFATGEVFNWINSDDYLAPGALMAIGEAFAQNPSAKIVCGYTYCFFDEDKAHSHTYRMGIKKSVADTILNVEMNQPGSFYKTEIIKEFNGVNESLRYVFDDELWFRFLCQYGKSGISMIPNIIANFRLHGDSKSVGEGFAGFHEEVQHLYYNLAIACHAPDWLLKKIEEQLKPSSQIEFKKWEIPFLETEKFLSAIAARYINSLYTSGQKKYAKEAMTMVIKNGYFKWNRMMISLRLKLGW